MTSNCVPQKSHRIIAINKARTALKEAIDILEEITEANIDSKARDIEHAHNLIDSIMGQRQGSFIDTNQSIGLSDLAEHYFS